MISFNLQKHLWDSLESFHRWGWESSSCLQGNPEEMGRKEQVPMVCGTYSLLSYQLPENPEPLDSSDDFTSSGDKDVWSHGVT